MTHAGRGNHINMRVRHVWVKTDSGVPGSGPNPTRLIEADKSHGLQGVVCVVSSQRAEDGRCNGKPCFSSLFHFLSFLIIFSSASTKPRHHLLCCTQLTCLSNHGSTTTRHLASWARPTSPSRWHVSLVSRCTVTMSWISTNLLRNCRYGGTWKW